MDKPLICVKWGDDCHDQKNYYEELMNINAGYWPQGGGFTVIEQKSNGETAIHDGDVSIPEGATASLDFMVNGCYFTLVKKEFKGDSFEDLAKQVQDWAQEQCNKLFDILQHHYEMEEF
jgi:hypothetical protein